MWIPYDIRGALKAATNPESIRLSLADGTPREFLIGFLLRNPVTQAWELDVVADPDGSEIADQDDEGALSLGYYGNEAGKLAEIIVRLTAVSASAALSRAHDLVQRRLLRAVVETGRGMAIAGWRIADGRHGARWRCTPFRPSALHLDHASLGAVPPDLAPLVELFQRARNAPDAAGRMLAAFAVLHAASNDHPALAGAGVKDFRVTQEMLVHAGALQDGAALTGADLAGLIAALHPHHDRLIGPDGILAALADDLAAQQALGRMANMADLAAHRLLSAALRARTTRASAHLGAPAPGGAERVLA